MMQKLFFCSIKNLLLPQVLDILLFIKSLNFISSDHFFIFGQPSYHVSPNTRDLLPIIAASNAALPEIDAVNFDLLINSNESVSESTKYTPWMFLIAS